MTARMGNGLVRVLLTVSIGINYTGRPCIGCFIYRRAINIYSVILYPCSTWPAVVIYSVNRYISAGDALDIFAARPGNISAVIINIRIVDDGSIMYNSNRPAPRNIIIINNRAVNISLRSAYPIIIGYTIAVTY